MSHGQAKKQIEERGNENCYQMKLARYLNDCGNLSFCSQ